MALYCPACKNEILPYLKTGELKEIKNNFLISYQLYYCIHCKTVYYQEHESVKFLPLKKEEQVAENAGKVSAGVAKKVGK